MTKITKKGKPVFSFLDKDDDIELFILEGMTINLENYESARVQIGLKVPLKAKDLEKAKQEVSEWIEDKLQEKFEEIANG